MNKIRKTKDKLYVKRFPGVKVSVEEKVVIEKLEKAAEGIASIYASQINDKFPGANFYPHDATKKEIIKAAEENPLILNPYTIVKRGKSGRLEVIPYHIKYARELKPIIALIREAANLSENREFAKRLELQADALESGSYEAADIYWLTMKPYKIAFIIGPAERYEDSLFFVKTTFSAVVGVMDEEATRKATLVRDAILAVQRKSFSLSQRVEIANRLQIRVDNTTLLSGLDARAMFAGAFLPVDPRLIEKYGGEVIIFNPVLEYNFRTKLLPIFKKTFSKSFQDGYSPELLMDASRTLLVIREISTGLVKYYDAEDRLGEYYPTINEVASYILAVKNAGSLLTKDIISQKELEAIIIMLLCRAFDSFSESRKVKSLTHYSQGYSIMVNYFLENGALREHQGFSWPNFTKVFVALTDLASALERILAFGDKEDIERLLNEYGDIKSFLRFTPKI